MNINNIISDLCATIDEISDIDEKIDTLNYVKKMLHQISPYRHHPVDYVEWIKTEGIEKNDYNPNHVAPPEAKLLHLSIREDGFTQPVVTYPHNPVNIIVDGFHRRKTVVEHKDISTSTYGRVPVTYIRNQQHDKSKRIASTVRHNRARGSHEIQLMVDIIAELNESGMSDKWILKQFGMDADELLRLKQLSGLASLFKDKEFTEQ